MTRRLPETFIASGCLLLCLALATCKGCATTTPGGTPTPVGTFTGCTDAAARAAAEGILGDVTTALATGDYEAQLAALVSEFGGDEVACAVSLVVAEFQVKASRSNDAEVGVVLAHGQAWLNGHVK